MYGQRFLLGDGRGVPAVGGSLHREYGVSVAPSEFDEWAWPVSGHDVHVGEVTVDLMCERRRWFLDVAEPLPGVRDGLYALSAGKAGVLFGV